ncbi:MAG: hypothetical protein KO202_02375 [Methanobacteriaceae archaeon]|jgi:hypothetical protein|nr:hypothetical protein [Methanobacteriaceae archaeon]
MRQKDQKVLMEFIDVEGDEKYFTIKVTKYIENGRPKVKYCYTFDQSLSEEEKRLFMDHLLYFEKALKKYSHMLVKKEYIEYIGDNDKWKVKYTLINEF